MGYDGHMLRAISYFNLPIDTNDVEAVNNAVEVYKTERQASKAPTFALTYQGCYLTLMNNCGFSEAEAKQIEKAYHDLYKVSDEWVESKIEQAYKDGYITTGFGLKVRTPFLKGKKYTKDRKGLEGSEARTAGNALGQGWGVLNDRAMNAVMNQIDELGLSLDILPVAKIHDACYYLVRNNIPTLLKLNELVVKEAHWNNHPDIYHPTVGLGGQLDVFYPDWAHPMTLPEDCSEEQLIQLVNQHKETLK